MVKLEDFEQFVFIMSVLKHYSDHDCALLLGCSIREIMEARGRAFWETGGLKPTKLFSGPTFGAGDEMNSDQLRMAKFRYTMQG